MLARSTARTYAYVVTLLLLSGAVLPSCSQDVAPTNVSAPIPREDFIVQAHRGAGNLAPENTLPSYQLSWDSGYVPEADVRFTADGVLIGFHDGNLSRVALYADPSIKTTPISELSWNQLKDVDVGSYFSPDHSHERIPKMSDVFAAMQGHKDRRLYLDLKTTKLKSVQSLAAGYGVESQLIVASSDYAMLKSWKSLSPTSYTLLWMGGAEAELTAKLNALKAVNFQSIDQLQIHVAVGDLDSFDPFCPTSAFLQSVASELRKRGILFQVFPSRGNAQYAAVYPRLLDLGVRSFATDNPDVALDAVRNYYVPPARERPSKKANSSCLPKGASRRASIACSFTDLIFS